MNPKKQKTKDRRRARKLAEQAWEAANEGNFDLAEKIIRRAVAVQEDNPVLWNDQGVLLARRNKDAESAESFRAALFLAPDYAEPFAHLAALRMRQGFVEEAVALQAQAVKHAPASAEYAERLQAYQALAGKADMVVAAPPVASLPMSDTWLEAPRDFGLAELDWHILQDRLTRDGYAVIGQLIDGETCEQLRRMFDDDERFAKTVTMDRSDFGQGTYRYFAAPIPGIVDDLRCAVYPYVAPIANAWRKMLGEPECYPPEWHAFRDECHHAGQTTPTPILLKYGAGGFNALHRDLRGGIFFPLQLAVVLSEHREVGEPVVDGFQGGEFLFCDVPEGRKARRQQIPLGQGDAVLFCTRDRLVRVGGAFGLQPVKHGVAPITTGTRFVLGVPFHEYR